MKLRFHYAESNKYLGLIHTKLVATQISHRVVYLVLDLKSFSKVAVIKYHGLSNFSHTYLLVTILHTETQSQDDSNVIYSEEFILVIELTLSSLHLQEAFPFVCQHLNSSSL